MLSISITTNNESQSQEGITNIYIAKNCRTATRQISNDYIATRDIIISIANWNRCNIKLFNIESQDTYGQGAVSTTANGLSLYLICYIQHKSITHLGKSQTLLRLSPQSLSTSLYDINK